jgi:hypothetical protein
MAIKLSSHYDCIMLLMGEKCNVRTSTLLFSVSVVASLKVITICHLNSATIGDKHGSLFSVTISYDIGLI